MTELQEKALHILRIRFESGRPSQWVWPGSVCMHSAPFRALWNAGKAERLVNDYGAYEYRLKKD